MFTTNVYIRDGAGDAWALHTTAQTQTDGAYKGTRIDIYFDRAALTYQWHTYGADGVQKGNGVGRDRLGVALESTRALVS